MKFKSETYCFMKCVFRHPTNLKLLDFDIAIKNILNIPLVFNMFKKCYVLFYFFTFSSQIFWVTNESLSFESTKLSPKCPSRSWLGQKSKLTEETALIVPLYWVASGLKKLCMRTVFWRLFTYMCSMTLVKVAL